MLHFLSPDSVRTHNELMHAGYTKQILIAIPILIVFVYLWTKFAKH